MDVFRLKDSHPLTGVALTYPMCLGLVGAVCLQLILYESGVALRALC